MWQLILEQIMREMQRQAANQAVRETGEAIGSDLIGELTKPGAYADRINKEFNLRNYAKAWDIFDSNRAYWEKLYGDDPLNSPNHPAEPPKSLLPRQPGVPDFGYNFLNPAPTSGNAFGRFGTGGQFAPGAATSSRPLYETQSFPPPAGSTPPDTIDESKPVRRLGVRVGDAPGATVFDIGTRAVPYVPPSSIPSPGSPMTLNERFETLLPPTNASPGAASPDDLEAFRRRWLETFMQP